MAGMNLNVGIKNFSHGTNIRDISVPAQLRKRHASGIEWIDEAMNGGFVPSTVHMLTGTPGAGKTTLLIQLAESLSRQGHIVLYNTGEESLYQTKLVCERLGVRHGFVVGQDMMVDEVIKHANMLMKKNPGKQVFVLQDSLQTMDDGKYADGGKTGNTPVRCCEKLTNWAKATFGIVIFIGQVTKSGEFVGKNTIKHAIDTHAHIYIDMDRKSEFYGQRVFNIEKARFGCDGKERCLAMGKTGLTMNKDYN